MFSSRYGFMRYLGWPGAALVLLSACLSGNGNNHITPDGHSLDGGSEKTRVKNVILFIGDGMGTSTMALLTQYRRTVTPEAAETSFEMIMNEHYMGLNDTNSFESLFTDSAASATQMGCGVMTYGGAIGLDKNGNPCRTVLEAAHDLGKSTGLITDTRITHATPAAFVAKQADRDEESAIADDIFYGVSKDKVQVLLGGGGRYLIPAATRLSQIPGCEDIDPSLDGTSRRTDSNNPIADARASGYAFACTAEALMSIPDETTKLLGVFSTSGFPNYLEQNRIAGLPTVKQMTEKALDILDNDQDGFFLMVEAGLIDSGAHNNDGAYVLSALQAADETLRYLMEYVRKHPDTLLIVTADHDTGGLSFSSKVGGNADPAESYAYLTSQTLSYGSMVSDIAARLYLPGYEPNPEYPLAQAAADLIARVEASSSFTLSEEEAREILAVEPGTTLVPLPDAIDEFYDGDPFIIRLGRKFVDEIQLVWSTGEHTSAPVPIMGMGPAEYARRVQGYGHSTRVADIIFAALKNE